jgi:hypothetical protein
MDCILQGFQDRRIEVDDLLPGWRFFDERPDDVAGSTGFVHNAGERLPHLRTTGEPSPNIGVTPYCPRSLEPSCARAFLAASQA